MIGSLSRTLSWTQLFRNSSTCRALCNAGLAADGTKLENIPRCGESQYNGVHISYFSSQQVLANNVKYNSFFSFKVILYEYIVVKTISLTFAKLRKLRKERKNWGSGDCRTRNISWLHTTLISRQSNGAIFFRITKFGVDKNWFHALIIMTWKCDVATNKPILPPLA